MTFTARLSELLQFQRARYVRIRAMTASEIASSVVYGGGWRKDYEESLADYVGHAFPARRRKGKT